MKHCKWSKAMLAAGLLCTFGGVGAEETEMDYQLDAALTESELQTQGARNPEQAFRALFSESAAKKWQSLTGDIFIPEQIRDFFCGSVLLRGPVSKDGAIAGFYNPWWDAILITESYQTTANVDGESGKIRKVNDFAFLSGAAFRGESLSDTAVAEQLAAPGGSPSRIVIRLMALTQRKFTDLYGSQSVPLLLEHPGDGTEASMRQIIACAGVRLKMTQLLLKNKIRYNDCWSLAKTLRTGEIGTFNLLFPSEFGTMMSQTFCRLPENIRADFEPYGYYPDRNGGKARVYVYINTRFPRLFAVTSVGLGSESSFEWYDFLRCEELLKGFEMAEKGGVK